MRLVSAAVFVAAVLVACGPSPSPDRDETGDTGAQLATGSFVEEVGGQLIHYEVHGSGPVVMTVPNSWGLSLEGLRGMYRPLEERLTMVYFDPRGMGESAPVETPDDMGMEAVREDFHALREHLGLDRVHAIGWSNGAMNLLLLASERPETLRSAIVVHSGASFGPEDMQELGARYPALFKDWGAQEAELATMDPEDPEATRRMKEFWLGRYFPEMTAAPEEAMPEISRVFGAAEFSRPHQLYTQTTYPTFDVRDRLADITVPTLVIAGTHDMLPPARVRIVAEGIPEARLVVFDASGHFAPLEEPDRFQELVFEFIGVAPQSQS